MISLKKSMAGRNIGNMCILVYDFKPRLIRCSFSSFCSVSTNKFSPYSSSQAFPDLTSDVEIVAFSFSIKNFDTVTNMPASCERSQ